MAMQPLSEPLNIQLGTDGRKTDEENQCDEKNSIVAKKVESAKTFPFLRDISGN